MKEMAIDTTPTYTDRGYGGFPRTLALENCTYDVTLQMPLDSSEKKKKKKKKIHTYIHTIRIKERNITLLSPPHRFDL